MTSERFVDGLEQRAAELLPEAVFRYFRQGARDGLSASEASAAWDRFRFLPHVLRDVTEVDLSTSVLGTTLRSPLAVAPTTLQRAAHPDGEVAMAAGVAEAGSLMVLSSNAGSTFEQVAAAQAPWWLQVYVTADRPTGGAAARTSRRARRARRRADRGHTGGRHKYDGAGPTVWDVADPAWLQANFPRRTASCPATRRPRTSARATWSGWPDTTGLPVVVKGVLRPDDARRCVEAGAAAVWVSNHGGRQLDGAAATADCLAGVVAEVGGHGRGVRRRGSAHRAARPGRPGARGRRGVPRPAAALRPHCRRRRRARSSPALDELEATGSRARPPSRAGTRPRADARRRMTSMWFTAPPPAPSRVPTKKRL